MSNHDIPCQVCGKDTRGLTGCRGEEAHQEEKPPLVAQAEELESNSAELKDEVDRKG